MIKSFVYGAIMDHSRYASVVWPDAGAPDMPIKKTRGSVWLSCRGVELSLMDAYSEMGRVGVGSDRAAGHLDDLACFLAFAVLARGLEGSFSRAFSACIAAEDLVFFVQFAASPLGLEGSSVGAGLGGIAALAGAFWPLGTDGLGTFFIRGTFDDGLLSLSFCVGRQGVASENKS